MGAAAGEGAPPLPAATGLPAPPGATAGEISFLPKLIRLFETLFIFRGAPLALVLLKKKKRWRHIVYIREQLLLYRAPHSSILAWRVPRTEEPGGLQSMGSLTVGHD